MTTTSTTTTYNSAENIISKKTDATRIKMLKKPKQTSVILENGIAARLRAYAHLGNKILAFSGKAEIIKDDEKECIIKINEVGLYPQVCRDNIISYPKNMVSSDGILVWGWCNDNGEDPRAENYSPETRDHWLTISFQVDKSGNITTSVANFNDNAILYDVPTTLIGEVDMEDEIRKEMLQKLTRIGAEITTTSPYYYGANHNTQNWHGY